jgi:hypothetical protein
MITMRIFCKLVTLAPAALMVACADADPLGPGPSLDLESPQALEAQEMKALPLHGSTTGMLVGMAPAPMGRCPLDRPILFSYRGEGNATHLGRFSVEGDECADPITMATGNGQFVLTAANGDKLFVAYDQTTVSFEAPPSPWMLWSSTPYLTGGTGRFQGAEFVEVTWGGGGNLATGEMYSNLDGWIRYDASRRREK